MKPGLTRIVSPPVILFAVFLKQIPPENGSPFETQKENILSYEGSLYYNPSSESVRNLIIQGVKEIVQNYNVDGIHMDDYFILIPTRARIFLIMSVLRNMVADTVIKPIGAVTT